MKKTILLADDDVAIRRAYGALLAGEGYDVVPARNGEEAVAKFQARKPDLVLLDVMMPKMNGMAACAEIRRCDATTPVLFVTAAPSEAAAVRALGLGADDYIDKSRPVAETLARIAAALWRQDAYEARAAASRAMVGDVAVDFDALRLVRPDGAGTDLTRSEAIVLKVLVSRRGAFVPTEDFIEELHADGGGGDAGLRVIISRLKQKLGRAGNLVMNNRSSGYKLIG